MMRSFFIVAIFLASIANTIMAFSPDSSSSTLQTSSFRKISSEITSDDLASAATSAVEEKENRWEAAVDSVHGASAYFASLHRLNSATREEDFRDFLADVSRITTHNAIVAKVEALYAQIAMSSSNGNPELWIAWQKARNYMVTLQNVYLKYLSVRRPLTHSHTHTLTHTHSLTHTHITGFRLYRVPTWRLHEKVHVPWIR